MAELTSRWGHCLSESWGVWHCEDSICVELVVGRNRLDIPRSLSVCMSRLGSTALGKSFMLSHSLNCIIGQCHSKFVSQFNSIALSCHVFANVKKHVDVCSGETTGRTRVSTRERGDVDCMRRFKNQLLVHSTTHVTCPFHAQKF